MERKKRILILSLVLFLPTCLLVYQIYYKSTQQTKVNSNSILNLETDDKYTLNNPQRINFKKADTEVSSDDYLQHPNDNSNNENGDTNPAEKDTIPSDSTKPSSGDTEITQNAFKSISIDSYKSNLTTSTYKVQSGDTISKILRTYEGTCNYTTGVKHLKLLNPQVDLDNLEIGSFINLPDKALANGRLYKVISGDTWYKLAKSNYPEYRTDDIIKFLISINNLPNSDLPLGENVFLPNL
ncbi:LysM domain-containing protein [Clostridium sp. 1001275B_160808_H3]|uniref:LysM peptidoglycan-binding domain-containing protein n=1 Tax=Clostridium sp. 1001275B_160808_H3 TaxID=2787110 RepID=UPI001899000A|nr:LysM domain-containing protein [Clostridium sp. 1001275B_160808_H3]